MMGRVSLLCAAVLPVVLHSAAIQHTQHVVEQQQQQQQQQQQHFLGVSKQEPAKPQYKESTANPTTCKIIYVVMMVGLAMQLVGQYVLGNSALMYSGVSIILFASTCAVIYSYQHGIFTQWWAGELDPVKFHYCHGVAGSAGVMYVWGACCCCVVGVVATVKISEKMSNDRERRMAELEKSDPVLFKQVSQRIESDDFISQCEKAFKEADADGNGKLDLAELQHVVVFGLSEEEKAEVTKHHLFEHLIDKDNFIDMEEFIEVMKWAQVTAKAKLAEEKQASQ